MTGTKVSGSALYLDTKLRYHLSGKIDIKVRPLDVDYNVYQYPQLQHSSGRSGLDWGSPGGRAVDQILGRIAARVRPELTNFILSRDGNKYEKLGRDFTGKMNAWLKNPRVREVLNKMDIEHFSTGDVPVSGGGDSALRCKKCGRLFGNGFILDTSGPIPMYRCRCGASYEKQKRSLPVSTIDEGTKKKPREKLHGRFGITIVLTPEVDRSIISMFDNGVIIVTGKQIGRAHV